MAAPASLVAAKMTPASNGAMSTLTSRITRALPHSVVQYIQRASLKERQTTTSIARKLQTSWQTHAHKTKFRMLVIFIAGVLLCIVLIALASSVSRLHRRIDAVENNRALGGHLHPVIASIETPKPSAAVWNDGRVDRADDHGVSAAQVLLPSSPPFPPLPRTTPPPRNAASERQRNTEKTTSLSRRHSV